MLNKFDLIRRVEDKNILIIGGTGTLGRAIVQKLLVLNPEHQIRIMSRDEIKQLEMIQDFPSESFPNLRFFLGDIRDYERLAEISLDVSVIINCAAIKHVVMAELNPEEVRKTNVLGTQNLIRVCESNKVKKCLIISTDKAIEPIGVYGKSKKEAEDLVISSKIETSFCIIRLGNILGSRASVVDVFRKMSESKVIDITDPDATRFGISDQDAAQFVVEHLAEVTGGQILTPEMKAFKVGDLAELIAPGCEWRIVGLRKGDKLHEKILVNDKLISSDQVERMEKAELASILGI